MRARYVPVKPRRRQQHTAKTDQLTHAQTPRPEQSVDLLSITCVDLSTGGMDATVFCLLTVLAKTVPQSWDVSSGTLWAVWQSGPHEQT